ncbi:MAG: 2-dehydropantoate 2-reductase [Solirubrobacteraceae bacterium]|nr:2-dehydropantoate 2-reductase [Solirubrobacteraceae bacterium]
MGTMRAMRVAVVGAGAIGAYVGAALARGGTDVHLIARGKNLEAMRRNGVKVLSDRGDFEAHPPATDDPSEVGPVDYVFLGLKANSYASAGPLLEPLLDEHTAVIAAQNGIPWWYFHGVDGPYAGRRIESVDPGGAVSRVIPPERAIGCVVYAGTELEAPGVVRHLEGTRFTIGEPDRTLSDRCRAFSEAMIAGGLKCPVEQDVRDEIWVKLMGNVAFNPLSALTRATMAEICRHDDARRLVAAMMEETLEIAEAVGAHPQISIEKRLAGAERVGEHKTSTLQDLEAGKPLELAAIIGAVVELADLTRIDAPALRAVEAASSLLARTLGLSDAA